MSRQLPLEDEDVTAIVRLLGAIAGSVEPLPQRRRALIGGLAGLVGADVWAWVISRGFASNAPAPLVWMCGGFSDPDEEIRFIRASADPAFSADLLPLIDPAHHRTSFANVTDPAWAATRTFRDFVVPHGFAHLMFSFYPLGDGAMSCFGLHRRAGREPFTPRQQTIAHLVTSQIDWLHRAGTDVKANGPTLETLSPRQREVLIYLLGGDARKQIARKMNLSEHTIGDYMKALHQHFHVNSRSELLAMFVGNGASPR